VYYGDWKILGTSKVGDFDFVKKNSVIEYEGDMWVQSFDGKLSHIASEEEVKSLRPPTTYSPSLLEKAIRYFHMGGEWKPEFGDLLVGGPVQSSRH
jgi:hypothetical protein